MSKILSLIQGKDNKTLRRKSVKIKKENIKSSEIRGLIDDMAITMADHKGIGLAAPQVGKNIRLFLISTDEGPIAFINPIILWKSLKKEIDEEGCLSLPGIWGKVKRSKTVRVKFLDHNGKKRILKAQGLFARAIQHENDHINGVLFIDKMIKK